MYIHNTTLTRSTAVALEIGQRRKIVKLASYVKETNFYQVANFKVLRSWTISKAIASGGRCCNEAGSFLPTS